MSDTTLVPYNPGRFAGGAGSYAAQGVCSHGDGRGATHMLVRHGRAMRALCDHHARAWTERHGASRWCYRQDTTTAEHQDQYRGRHLPGEGRWSYGPGGARYLRCSCGWRLVNIPDTPAGRGKARQLFAEHTA